MHDPENAKSEVETLLNQGLPFAEQLLDEKGQFFPFAFALDSDGDPIAVGADPGDEDVQPAELLAFLEMSLRQGVTEGKYRAIALFVDVRVEVPGQVEKTDAVQAGLEHKTGYCVDVFLPYEKQDDDSVVYGDLFAGPRQSSVFTSCRVN